MKRWKKFLALLLTVVMLAALPGTAWAADEVASGECGDALTWTLDSDGVLTISGTGAMEEWNKPTPVPWDEYKESINSVRIEDGVTNIGDHSFENCTGLTNITIPEGVTSIGYYVFENCTGLTNITIPESVTSIGYYVFENCTGLTNITIPESVTSIGVGAFRNCTGLTNITIPEGVTSIESGTFQSCTSLTNITIPEGVTSIGYDAFNGCENLTSVTIPEGVTSIWNGAFWSCTSLTSITIPEGVTHIGNSTFYRCTSLTNITIPESVTSIVDGAFNSCTNLADVYYNGTKAQWEQIDINNDENGNAHLLSATIHCSDGDINPKEEETNNKCGDNLTWTLEEGVLTISGTGPMWDYVTMIADGPSWSGHDGKYEPAPWLTSTTDYNQDITSVVLSEGVTAIGDAAFSSCIALSKVTIPSTVTSIGQAAFLECGSLTEISIPSSVTAVKPFAFYGCAHLADVYYSGTETEWTAMEIGSYNDPLLNATIHYGKSTAIPLESGVKYVPYSWKPEESSGTYSIVGVLPNRLDLDPQTGEIAGIPMVSGTWTFSVSNQGTETAYTLTIADNSNDAVDGSNDNSYEITRPVGTEISPNNFVLYEYTNRTMRIEGPYNDFRELYIDGNRLTRDVDYEAREGSTVITIYAQTFKKYGEGTHTLSAEYREGGKPEGKLTTVSQNYTVSLSQPSTPSKPSGSSSGSSNKKPSSNSKPTTATTPAAPTTPPVTPTPAPVPALPFGDVSESDWFYGDVKWAYDGEIMTGVTATSFAPAQSISQATIVTVLARLGNIDLTRYETASDESIESGKWYTSAAIWAKQSGILPDYSAFTGEETISRDQMAIMLVKYLRSMGKDTTPPAQAAAFADADEMTQDGSDAFQVLYRYNIFRGVGDGRMDPAGSTTRAQFAALSHRVAGV